MKLPEFRLDTGTWAWGLCPGPLFAQPQGENGRGGLPDLFPAFTVSSIGKCNNVEAAQRGDGVPREYSTFVCEIFPQ